MLYSPRRHVHASTHSHTPYHIYITHIIYTEQTLILLYMYMYTHAHTLTHTVTLNKKLTPNYLLF
jgi:hypothetical protein